MDRKPRRSAVPVSDLVARIIGPVAAKRGFASTDLVASWAEIAGARIADCSRPEKIAWPRDPDAPGVLVLRVDGPAAILIQHEADQIVERVNTYMGYRAVDRMRIVQGPLAGPARVQPPEPPPPVPLPQDVAERIEQTDGDGALRDALERLAHGVFTERK